MRAAERGDRRQGHAEARPPRSAATVSAAAIRARAAPDLAQVVAGQLGAFAIAQALADLKRLVELGEGVLALSQAEREAPS